MGDDYERLGNEAPSVSIFIGNRCYLRMHRDHCAQLTVDETGRFSCHIYPSRPDICRTLERGSPECAAERERKTAASQRMLGQVRDSTRQHRPANRSP